MREPHSNGSPENGMRAAAQQRAPRADRPLRNLIAPVRGRSGGIIYKELLRDYVVRCLGQVPVFQVPQVPDS